MMAGSAKYALPEHWTDLGASRLHRQQCADQVEEVKKACLTGCGKQHVTACPECNAKMLDTMRDRYCKVEGREWFSQRSALLTELDAMFADAKDGNIDLKTIEARIESEKEAWYRWVLRTYPAFLAAGGTGVDQDELRGMLDDSDKSRQELVQSVWKGVGEPKGWDADVDALAAKVAAAKGDAAELKRLYVACFFKDRDGQVLPHAQRYLDEYEASPGMALEEVVDRIARDHRANRSFQPQRDHHQGRLDELRRAKMAFEQNRIQTKSRAQGAQAQGAVAEDLYSLPPCAVCEKAVGAKDVRSCVLCQTVSQLGGQAKLRVYCSAVCEDKGQAEHEEKEHDCEAGGKCVQNTDEDVAMGNDGDVPETVVCKDCLAEKRAAVYCSERCATENLTSHRQAQHGTKTEAGGEAGGLVIRLSEVVNTTLKEKNPGLKFIAT